MPRKPLCARNSAKLIPVLANFTCIQCQKSHPEIPPLYGARVYNFECGTCRLTYHFGFYRTGWSWWMSHQLVINGHEWMTRYEPAENRTYFWRMVDFDVADEREFAGYVSHERFKGLIAFL